MESELVGCRGFSHDGTGQENGTLPKRESFIISTVLENLSSILHFTTPKEKSLGQNNVVVVQMADIVEICNAKSTLLSSL